VYAHKNGLNLLGIYARQAGVVAGHREPTGDPLPQVMGMTVV
jgi:hypothetical protein